MFSSLLVRIACRAVPTTVFLFFFGREIGSCATAGHDGVSRYGSGPGMCPPPNPPQYMPTISETRGRVVAPLPST